MFNPLTYLRGKLAFFSRSSGEATGTARPRRLRLILGLAAVFLLLYYPVGMFLAHTVNDDVEFAVPADRILPNGSRAVSMAIALISRETEQTKWVANKPWIFPSSALDNMPNFQIGLMYALSRFALEMTDVLGRTRGTSQVDPDLDKASGLLKYDGRIWLWEPSTSLLPTASAEKQYISGMKSLERYNRRLSEGTAVFERRSDNLISLLDRIGADLGSASASLDARATASNAGWFDTNGDDVFYATKGRLYGYYMLLRELGVDFQPVLAEKKVEQAWQQMLESLRTASEMDPLIVSNGSTDGLFIPSHLEAQGFYLLRSRIQLKEVSNILLK